MKINKVFGLIILYFILFSKNYSQKLQDIKCGIFDTIVVAMVFYNNEWLTYKDLEEISIITELTEEQKNRKKDWYKLKRTVFLTYPYMKAVSNIINEINSNKLSIKDEKKLKEFLKLKETELKEKFTDRLLNMTTYQGKILIKLIYREMGLTCYDVIKMYKGTATAITWQTLALIFGNSLTKKYDPIGEDMEMEAIVLEAKKTYGF